jgi:arylsulfatase A-like enzyme
MSANVLMIVIDSLRSDKLFGEEKTAKTPILDDLIKDGLFFPNNISSADGTVLSWAGMFTSLNPLKTGIKSERYSKIDSNILNYFSLIKKEGYHVFGCVPKFANAFGMMKEFENNDKTYDHFQSLSEGLGKKILSQLKSNSMKEPWFYFVHINDIHFPVIPPKSYDDQRFGESKYDRTVSSIDEWIGKILECVDLTKTLVVITSDHGANVSSVKIGNQYINCETDGSKQKFTTKMGNKIPSFLDPIKSKLFFKVENYRKKIKEKKSQEFSLTPYQKRSLFSQRGDLDHTLFDERIRVPLLFSGYEINFKKIITSQVRTIDIFPTIFDILGLKSYEKNVDGKTLISLINDESIDELPALIISSPLIEVKSNDVIGLRTSKYKYFRDIEIPQNRVHLFDLQADPLEENNIAKENPQIIKEMEDIILQKQTESKSDKSEYDEDELKNIEKELKKMGYI